MSIRRSGLQKEVLALYRRALRIPSTKPSPIRSKFLLFIRYTFRTQANSISSRDVAAIEHLLRKGRRQLEGLEDTGVKDVRVSEEMRNWEKTRSMPR